MTEYDNTNRWTLNKNDKKREGKQDADYNGSINVNGVEYWLNGWIKEGRNGKFISGSIKPKEAQTQEPRRSVPISSGLDDDRDIPF
jgi:hypothetical protein